MKSINFIGSAFGCGAQIYSTDLGPVFIKDEYDIVEKLRQTNVLSYWYATVQNTRYDLSETPNKGKNYKAVLSHNCNLYNKVQACITEYPQAIPFIIGGDHSCAIGTWLGVIDKLNASDNFGLIWIDAHMDAHTYDTSQSKSYHGMPLSILLGYGDQTLQSIGNCGKRRRINPELLILIGVRSYEPEEEKWLKSLDVKIISIDEVRKKGLRQVFQDALELVTKATRGFGVSIDLDAIDPSDAPGVNSPEPHGILWEEMKEHLHLILTHPELKAIEIAEFDPTIDHNNSTAEIILQIALKLGNIAKNEKLL